MLSYRSSTCYMKNHNLLISIKRMLHEKLQPPLLFKRYIQRVHREGKLSVRAKTCLSSVYMLYPSHIDNRFSVKPAASFSIHSLYTTHTENANFLSE